MPELIGEYECKIDSKGRLRLPADLLRQLHGFGSGTCVVNRGLQSYLTLYPKSVWAGESARVNALNPYIQANMMFKRHFYAGATELTPDSAERILIPQSLREHAKIKKTVMLQAMNDRVELWDKDEYLNMLSAMPTDFSAIAEQVWGSQPVLMPPPPVPPQNPNPNNPGDVVS